MIVFEIIDSPDKEVLGSHSYYSNELVLGLTQGDLLVQDKEWTEIVFFFYFNEKKLWVKKSEKMEFFHINGKKIITEMIVKMNDVLEFGQTQIMVMMAQEEPELTKKEVVEKGMEKILNDISLTYVKEFFDILEVELENLNTHKKRG